MKYMWFPKGDSQWDLSCQSVKSYQTPTGTLSVSVLVPMTHASWSFNSLFSLTRGDAVELLPEEPEPDSWSPLPDLAVAREDVPIKNQNKFNAINFLIKNISMNILYYL